MPCHQEAFHHHAENALFALNQTSRDLLDHFGLTHFILATVAMRGIDHQTMLARTGRLRIMQRIQCRPDRLGIVIRTGRRATQHQVTIRIAFGLGGNHTPIQIDGQEMMLERGSITGISRGLDGTVRGILEPDRHRQATGQLAVHLAFGIARTNGAPADRIADILRGDRVKPFGSDRQTQRQHIGKHLACLPHALTNIELAIEIRIVDQTLPTDSGTRLLEIHAHNDQQTIVQLALHRGKLLGILMRGLGIMNGTRAHNDQQTVIAPAQHITDLLTRRTHQLAHLLGERQLAQKRARSRNRIKLTNIDIHRLGKDGLLPQTTLIFGTVRTT